jgi:hypothetical protein
MSTTSESGGVTLSSSHTDGGHSATFSYTAAWNTDANNFDESVSVSGSKKVGNWTASSSATSHMLKDASGAGVDQAGADNQRPMNSHNSAVITLTDGSITYKLGDAAHLSTAEKTSGGPMSGAQDSEASVDSFNGFSVGLGVGPGTLTVALDMHAGASGTVLGETAAGAATAMACGGQLTGFGFNFAGDVGADLTFTYGSGSAAMSASACTGDNSTNAFSYNTMGLGVAVPVGGMTIAFDYGSNVALYTTGTSEDGSAVAGWEISLTMPVGDATAGVNLSSKATITTDAGSAGDAAVTGGTELWYTVPIGAASLSAGYGSAAATSVAGDTTTTTEIGAEMSMSF